MARSNRSILSRFFNWSGHIKDSPAALSLGAVGTFYFCVKTILAGELNLSRSSLSPKMLSYAEHPVMFSLMMLLLLIGIVCLFLRAYQCWIDSSEES